MLNFKIMKHPMNWLVVFMMLTLAATGGHLLLSYFGVAPATSDK